jgi:DNA-binding PucR family transcriptional regulator
MPAARRASVGLVAQAGIASFVGWYQDPKAQPWVAADVFSAAPRELLRSISLQETLQLIRVVVQVVEDTVVPQDESLREAVLLYSREIAFSAADVYARAAEARGLWDARLEALVVDSILSGEAEEELPSRIAALGWRARGSVAVIVGTAKKSFDADSLRRSARRASADVLVGVHGDRLIVVVGRTDSSSEGSQKPFRQIAESISNEFGGGAIVLGPEVSGVNNAHTSAKAALSGFSVLKTSRTPSGLIAADDLLAERALAGDMLAKTTLVERIYVPLSTASSELLETLNAYLESGRSLESTSRALFVHANTVRYRLKRISEIIGWDATGAREAFVLQVAMVLGSMSESETR